MDKELQELMRRTNRLMLKESSVVETPTDTVSEDKDEEDCELMSFKEWRKQHPDIHNHGKAKRAYKSWCGTQKAKMDETVAYAHPEETDGLEKYTARNGETIVTHYENPPVPSRGYDWVATLDSYDGAPDAGYQPIGYGASEDEAIADLNDKLDEPIIMPESKSVEDFEAEFKQFNESYRPSTDNFEYSYYDDELEKEVTLRYSCDSDGYIEVSSSTVYDPETGETMDGDDIIDFNNLPEDAMIDAAGEQYQDDMDGYGDYQYDMNREMYDSVGDEIDDRKKKKKEEVSEFKDDNMDGIDDDLSLGDIASGEEDLDSTHLSQDELAKLRWMLTLLGENKQYSYAVRAYEKIRQGKPVTIPQERQIIKLLMDLFLQADKGALRIFLNRII